MMLVLLPGPRGEESSLVGEEEDAHFPIRRRPSCTDQSGFHADFHRTAGSVLVPT